jgi:hypothetical protein
MQYVQHGSVIRTIPLDSFRATGGYAIDELQPKDINNNHDVAAMQFTFQQPVTVLAFRLIQTKVRLW